MNRTIIAPRPSPLAARGLALMLALGFAASAHAAHAARAPVTVEGAWTSPDLAKRTIRSVAVLPAITTGTYSPSHLLSDSLERSFHGDGRRWMTPLMAWSALGGSEIERLTLFRKVAEQVRDRGRTDAATSALVTAKLGVDALMLVRVDRWEQVADATDVTYVEGRVELVTAAGEPLWRIAGGSRVYTTSYRAPVDLPPASQGTKITETIAAGSGGGSSGGSSGGTSGGVANAGSASTSGNTSSQQSSPPRYTTKVEHKQTSTEDLLRATAGNPAPVPTEKFPEAVRLLVEAWAAKRPAGWASAAADSGARAPKR